MIHSASILASSLKKKKSFISSLSFVGHLGGLTWVGHSSPKSSASRSDSVCRISLCPNSAMAASVGDL